jgi:hypothetical protein
VTSAREASTFDLCKKMGVCTCGTVVFESFSDNLNPLGEDGGSLRDEGVGQPHFVGEVAGLIVASQGRYNLLETISNCGDIGKVEGSEGITVHQV